MDPNLAQLIECCKKQDRGAQFQIYRVFAPKMLAVVSRYTCDSMEAEDILLVGFTKAFKNIHNYMAKGAFEGWIKKIMINTALTQIKSRQAYMRLNIGFASILEEKTFSYEMKDVSHLLQALNSLPNTLKIPFTLFAIEGYCHKEISGQLCISEALSKTRVLRARKILRDRLKAREKIINYSIYSG